LARVLLDERSSTLVAELDGAVAGFATTITPNRDEDAGPRTSELAALCVQPECSRRGIGRALLREAMDGARSGGSDDIVAWVRASNAAARAFYGCFAFTPDGAQQLHARTGQTANRHEPR
jgi:ribosomal protein S18 acetylase RimI-like enzyme